MPIDPDFKLILDCLAPPSLSEMHSIRSITEPWKNPELESLALRFARLVTPHTESERIEKWAIIDTLHEIDGRATIKNSGGTLTEPNNCSVCLNRCYPPAPPCNYCYQPVCRGCRVAGRHAHTDDERVVVAFCFPCGRLNEISYDDKNIPRCVVCDAEWSPRAAVGVSNPGEIICPFCAALQKRTIVQAPCAQCASSLS